MDKFLKTTLEAANQASQVLRNGFKAVEKVRVRDKKSGPLPDIVSKFDYQSQDIIVNLISKNFPDHSILSEEGIEKGSSEYKWIIDPLDGTNNFIRGIPDFAVSIALTRRDRIILGVVALPYENEIYWATEKVPTHLNGRRVKVGNVKKLKSSTVGISMLRSREAVELGAKTFMKLMKIPIKPRIFGAIAADLARLSSGKLDALVFNHNQPWDIAAGIFLVERAGGKVSPTVGKDKLRAKQLVASNVYLHNPLLNSLKKK